MKILLIGHRGVGKTQLLHRLLISASLRGRPGEFFDLDREIETFTGQKISDLFRKSESEFRKLEIQVLERLREKEIYCIAVGAGCELEKLKPASDEEKIWVRRVTDSLPRYLLDRPRLEPRLSRDEEHARRFPEREAKYRRAADRVYQLPEGLSSPNGLEQHLIFGGGPRLGGGLSLRPEHFAKSDFWRERGHDFYELRDDIFSREEILQLAQALPKNKLLISLRSRDQSLDFIKKTASLGQTDWAMELGPSPIGSSIVSSHSLIPPTGADHLKWAPTLSSFKEVLQGLEWQSQAPEKRSFLPRGDGRDFVWARLLLKGRQQLQFIDDGWANDPHQPTLFEWSACPWMPKRFAAVLGDPVLHSHSPAEHLLFSAERGLPYFRLQLRAGELREHWSALRSLGLTLASVTSPLKKELFTLDLAKTEEAMRLQSANTLWLQEDAGLITNTDALGLRESLNENFESVLIWGGGGVLSAVKDVFPQAVHVSSRNEEKIEGHFDLLVWAASPQAAPPRLSSVRWVLDLNYHENSRGALWAQELGARYINGRLFFQAQARYQQDFWGERCPPIASAKD